MPQSPDVQDAPDQPNAPRPLGIPEAAFKGLGSIENPEEFRAAANRLMTLHFATLDQRDSISMMGAQIFNRLVRAIPGERREDFDGNEWHRNGSNGWTTEGPPGLQWSDTQMNRMTALIRPPNS